MVQIVDKPGTAELLGAGLGTGIGKGLEALAAGKLQEIQAGKGLLPGISGPADLQERKFAYQQQKDIKAKEEAERKIIDEETRPYHDKLVAYHDITGPADLRLNK